MTLALAVLAAISTTVLVVLGVAVARFWAAQALEDPALDADDTLDTLAPGSTRLALLPEGHQPPPGLSPLSPSERFLAAESARGLRALQDYLAQAA